MAVANLQAWLKLELTFEGGKVDDPQDPGGRTAYGVTQRVYNAYRKTQGKPAQDVYRIDMREVLLIFKEQYWDKVAGDELPDGLDVVVADGAVNSGVAQSVKWLQRALGTVRVDGIMGASTLKAAQATPDIDQLIAKVIARRNAFLKALRTFKRFGRGWLSRTSQVSRIGQDLGRGSVPPVARRVPDMNRKALLEDATPLPPKLDAVWGAGTGTGVLAQATAALEPLQNIERIATLLAWVTFAGVVLGIAGGAWAWYARQRSAKIQDALDTRPSRPANDNAEPDDEPLDLPPTDTPTDDVLSQVRSAA